jgi:putative aldouronate transport system permease protein
VFKGVWESPWARNNGLEHFIDLFSSPQVWGVLRNTLVLALLSLVFVQIPPVLFAMLLNEIRARYFKRITQTLSYLPHFVSWIVIGGIMFMMFLPTRSAPVNRVLIALGVAVKPTDIMNNPDTIWLVFVLAELWKHLGWNSIIYLAVIASIDPNLYEAIEIDGGGRLAKMRFITWPSLKATFMILFILKCGRIMSAGGFFDQSYILGTAANKSMSQVLDVYILRIGLEQARYSFAAAVGLLQQFVNLLLLVTANWASRRVTGKGLF